MTDEACDDDESKDAHFPIADNRVIIGILILGAGCVNSHEVDHRSVISEKHNGCCGDFCGEYLLFGTCRRLDLQWI